MKLSICVPTYGQIKWQFFKTMMLTKKPKDDWELITVGSLNVAHARNCCVDDSKGDYIFFTDPDMVLPENVFEILLEDMKEWPIVSGLYYSRHPPYVIQAYDYKKEIGFYNTNIDTEYDGLIFPNNKKKLQTVDGIGMACTMIDRKLFDKLEKPYFKLGDGGETEDLYLCRKLLKLGIRPKIDCRVKCGHMGELNINGEMTPAQRFSNMDFKLIK